MFNQHLDAGDEARDEEEKGIKIGSMVTNIVII